MTHDTPRTELIALASGRQVAVHEVTDGPRPVVFCHAAPGAGGFDPDPIQTAERNVRLIGAKTLLLYGQADDIGPPTAAGGRVRSKAPAWRPSPARATC